MTAFAIAAARLFDGTDMHEGRVVVVRDGKVEVHVPADQVDPTLPMHKVDGLLAPGFIDVQVNGGGGVLFNDATDVAGIDAIGAAHRRFGTTGFLPTLITDSRDRMAAAVDATRAALAAGVPGLLGVHLEGPFLNPQRKGAHDAAQMRAVEEADIAIMTGLNAGRTLVTLAPETVSPEMVARLSAAGVVISAGHTAADPATLHQARLRGMRGYTHLFNAMPPLAGRAPGPVGAALSERETWCSVIADMHHVAAPALAAAIAAKGADKIMLISDAMPTVGSDVATFQLQGQDIHRAGDRLVTDDGTLAGAHLDMATAVRNVVTHLGVAVADALRMASLVPAAFLRLDGELGRIAPGYRANLVLLDDALAARATWIDGVAYDGDGLPKQRSTAP